MVPGYKCADARGQIAGLDTKVGFRGELFYLWSLTIAI